MMPWPTSVNCKGCPYDGAQTGCCQPPPLQAVASFEIKVRDYIEDPIKLDDLPRNRRERRRMWKTGHR